ncbi:MAG: AAA family ATPase [Deltaproteobacteria bacterium]|nr:AAA family ATPase [Deltaproteobacteria bacterium]
METSRRHVPATPSPASGYRLLLQKDVFESLTDPCQAQPYRKRLLLAMRHLAARGRTPIAKGTRGAGDGWSRAPLGGNGGFQWYLWFARAGTPPARAARLEDREILLGAIRHHEQNDLPLEPDDRELLSEYSIAELREDREPFTGEQRSVLTCGSSVLFVKGHPGTGKTTTLWLGLEGRPRPGRVLYVTYGERLAHEARAHLAAFRTPGDEIEVVTFAELLGKLGGRPVSLGTLQDQVASMSAALADYRQPWSVWREHVARLHTELHAHFVGRALPEPWRDRAPCSNRWLYPEVYVELRSEKLGKKPAEEAARLGSFLAERGSLGEIAPGPFAAHDALEGLRARGCPPEWRDVDEIVVDEVQDLTPIEVLLLRELVQAIGRGRETPPRLVVAGDEAQTVRPTDFEWAELASILQPLGPSAELVLTGNVRSPKTLGSVIRASWRLYQRVAKDERPRGSGDVAIDEATTGRVVLCRVGKSDDLERLAAALRKLGAVIVRPRDPLTKDPLSNASDGPAEVKGLDFELVAVLDASKAIADIEQLDQRYQDGGEKASSVWARSLADGLRVALSRSTETLILIERTSEGAALVRERLCGALSAPSEVEFDLDDGFVDVEAADLHSGLAEAAHRDEIMARLLNDIPKFLDEEPRRALELARLAAGLRGRKGLPGALIHETQRRDAARWRAVAAVRVSGTEDTTLPEAARLLDEARRYFDKAEAPELANLARCLRAVRGERADTRQATALCDAYRSARAVADDVQPVVVRALWKIVVSASERLPNDPGRLREVADLARAVESLLPADRFDVLAACGDLRLDVVGKLVELRRWGDALESLRGIDDRRSDGRRRRLLFEARCHESGDVELGFDPERAAALYLEAGEPEQAIRMWRDRGDTSRALAVAEGSDDLTAALLRRTIELTRVLAELSAPGPGLTPAEAERVRAAFDRMMASRAPGDQTATHATRSRKPARARRGRVMSERPLAPDDDDALDDRATSPTAWAAR